MSVFRSFSKVLSQATLNAQKKTYIVNQPFAIQNPALYYLSQTAPPQDIYGLSLVSYHLVRKHEVGRNLLQQIAGETESSASSNLLKYRENLTVESEKDQRLASEYVDRIAHLLRTHTGDLPVHNAIQALYAFEATGRSDLALYEEYLFPIIASKIQYASLNNLIELTTILSNLNYYQNTELWNTIVQQISQKFDRPGPKYVKTSGWDLDTYELEEKGNKTDFQTASERHLEQLRTGNGQLADLRNEIRRVVDYVKTRYLYRFFFSEARIEQTGDNFTESLDRERLRKSLQTAGQNGINVSQVVERLRA